MNHTKTLTYRTFILIFLVLLTSLFNLSAVSKIKNKAEAIISEIIDKDTNLVFKKLVIESGIKKKIEKKFRQRFYKSWLYYWEIKEGNKIIAYALLDNVYGKSLPITFVTVFNDKGDIIGTRIVKYREPHGNEVKNRKWLSNFIGKNSSSSFKKDQDIDGISGATISSASIIKGNGKLACLISYLIGKNK